MAEKRRFLDVWIVESNTVYQEVPFEVVADWLQQGRLLIASPFDYGRPSRPSRESCLKRNEWVRDKCERARDPGPSAGVWTDAPI